MNIFCYPGVETLELITLLRLPTWERPCFGVCFNVSRERGGRATELDMVIGEVSFEAKLTERDFTWRSERIVREYRDLDEVFEVNALPQRKGKFGSYQLIRNVLAAHQRPGQFVLLCDERRPDLVRDWDAIRDTIKDRALRDRCVQVSWQRIAAVVPTPLQSFLVKKYGIMPTA